MRRAKCPSYSGKFRGRDEAIAGASGIGSVIQASSKVVLSLVKKTLIFPVRKTEMSTAYPSPAPKPDLTHLTEEERNIIQSVIDRQKACDAETFQLQR